MSKIKCYCFMALAAGLLVAACGGGGGSSPTTPAPAPMPKTVTVQIQDFQYSPKDIQINPGDTVQWVLAGPTHIHTVTATDGSFDSGFIFTATGATYSRTFTQSGTTVRYQCKSHYVCCGMAGSIQVGSNAPPPPPGY